MFDSGVGGLTVLRALREQLPQEDFVYLGDTARLPYGTKSHDTVARYAVQAAAALVARDVKALIIACNTASAIALPALTQHFSTLPVLGVVEPGAQAACDATRSARIAVIATEATVREGAYQAAIARRRPDAQVRAAACQVFVALAEEGWSEGPVVRAAARQYLQPLFGPEAGPFAIDTLVLGCTHFPILQSALAAELAELCPARSISIVDSAATTARATRSLLARVGLLRDNAVARGGVRFLATDGVGRFVTVGSRFLGSSIAAHEVELVDL